jgi:glycosyltransferase XagB
LFTKTNKSKLIPTAKDGLSSTQFRGLILLLLFLALLPFVTNTPIAILAALFSPVFLSLLILNLGMSIDSLTADANENDSPALHDDKNRDWPLYSLLIPLLNEDDVIDQLCAALDNLDYPKERLEIFFLLEEDDQKTLAAFQACPRLASKQILIVPNGHPRTKPRALNHGLAYAQGQYVTVYDAEDIPDRNQLKRAVQLFEKNPSDVFCLQAHLVIDNASDSWFSRMMMIEYAALFEITKPGLGRYGFPVALGGTSNHFKREALEKLGGWDAYNVTEDADMGFRIARSGGRVIDLTSETREEAPIHFKDWLGQRRRWLKGWMQTGITHSRNPRLAINAMGFKNWVIAMTQVIGIIASSLLYPLFSGWLILTIWDGTLFQTAHWLDIVQNSFAIVIFLAGLIAMFLPAYLGLRKRKALRYAAWLLTIPLYQLMIFYAACCAVYDLTTNPFHWVKTRHGLGTRGVGKKTA